MTRAGAVGLLALLVASPAGAESSALDLRALDDDARAPKTEVQIAPSPRGVLGAWLVAGPLPANGRGFAGAGVDAGTLAPKLGGQVAGTSFQIASSGEGPIDLVRALGARGQQDVVAYAGAVVHVERGGRHHLLLGVDDGVRVRVDGKIVYTRDEARPVREDDDVVPLDLAAGDHSLVLELHQRDGAWAFRARLVDDVLAPSPGLYARLPGTTAEDARALATKMSWVSFGRTFDALAEPPAYTPRLVVRFPEGAPRGVPLAVRATLGGAFDVRAGEVPVTAEGVSELTIALPRAAATAQERVLEVEVAGRSVRPPLPSRITTEAALVRASRALAKTPDDAPFLAPGSRTSVAHLVERLSSLVSRGDTDESAQADEARELDELAAALEQGKDPYEGRAGVMRRALRSPLDGATTELGLYVPPSYDAHAPRPLPLVVALHGMNGYPLAMIRWLFGGDDPKHDQAWEDRHVGTIPNVDAFVVAPSGRGNTMYRDLGEEDVAYVVDWVRRTYPIDPARVTITGPSMGGIGSGSIPLRRPNVYAAAAPLCGYHSLFVRRDVWGRPIRPWERFLAEERSAAFWAENGERLPLYVVHGTRDLPVENSGVLIDRYEKLGYSVKHEHPDLGHNVWQPFYENLAGLKWLLGKKLDLAPAHVRFRTARTRWGKSAWVHVRELATESAWGEVDVRAKSKTRIAGTTSNVAALSFERDPNVVDAAGEITVDLDGRSLVFASGEPLAVHVPDGAAAKAWEKGAPSHERPVKGGTITGPLRDVLFEPSLVVYADDAERRANEEVARSLSRVRPGLTVAYPVMTDTEFLTRGEPLANDRALVLVGRNNRVLAELDRIERFPIQVTSGEVVVGSERFTAKELGAAFIRPNPARRDRYVVVVAGADVPGMLRATSIPDLAPDFVVWDAAIAPSRGQLLLGPGALRAGGLFRRDWSLPASIRDPLADTARPGAKNERDATPYLP